MGNVWVRSSCGIQLWLVNHKNCITDILLSIFYAIDLIAYSAGGALKFLERRKEIYGPNYASLGRIITGEYEKCAEIIQSPQQRGLYLGRAKLYRSKVPSSFLLFLSDEDAGGDETHATIHQHLWETLIPPSVKLLDSEPSFQTYLNDAVTMIKKINKEKMTVKELKPIVQTMCVKYVFHAILGQALTNEQVKAADILFNGNSPFSSYTLGATKPFAGPLFCCQGKRSKLHSMMMEAVLNSPALKDYTPSSVTANLAKEDYADLVLSITGIAGCLGCKNLCFQILTAIPNDYPIDLEDKMEVTLAVLEAARIEAPVNSVTVILQNELTLMIKEKKYTFPQGTAVLGSIVLSSVDESKFKDPKKFNPKRENLMSSCLNFNHVGFSHVGSGTRQCPGRNIAIKMACDLLITLRTEKFE